VGGRWPLKAIPDSIAAELARLFCDGIGADVLLLGGESDRKRAIEIAGQCGYRSVQPVAGEGGVGKLIQRTESLDLLISPDSGPAHLGISLGVPTQVIFTSTSPSLGFYSPGFTGAYIVPNLSCRPCHRHGGSRCVTGSDQCRNMLLSREIFEEALCLMR
jgi:heptosyltransferase-2